ncbi:PSD1 and planctomycete cytochrome C domain-containing protein [bacterium]|nr:PSD1 and planctomycete cytochrome C domain-containing protein [bacterium]
MKHVYAITLFLLINQGQVASADVDYLTQIKPLLSQKCYSCHGVLTQEAGLRLETVALMVKGGDTGSVLVKGNSNDSLLLQRVIADSDSRMPPAEDGAALKPEEVQLLRRWIGEGAHAPVEETPRGLRDHWAFQTIQQAALPAAATGNPIDVFLKVKRDELKLKTQPTGDRSLLIRRLYLDLIGLPPTLTQLHDKRPWAEIVDELLASPHHGERWGRHWMDVWRYSDWYGLGTQLRNSQKHMWHWRDWIIDSLNRDKGYDRMVQEMVAGDEVAPHDREAITATGFLARNYYLFNRTTWLDSTIEHTGKAFLGLTLNCAKCHDHKYDPITHEDYYSFRALFEPHHVRLDPVRGVLDFDKDGLPRVFDDHIDAETRLHLKGDPKNPDKDTQIAPRVPALFASFQPKIEAVKLPPSAFAPGRIAMVQEDHLGAARAKLKSAGKELESAKLKRASVPKSSVAKKEDSTDSNFAFVDDFDEFDPQAWELVGADWKFANGTLSRSSSTRAREYVRLRQQLPRDFEVTCRYTTTGGDTYKSVTFRFDESADGKYSNYVYTSAHAPGPKLQVAYTRNGASVYPGEGRKAYPVKVGDVLELKFAVRDRLVNVWLDGKFQVAYLLPDRRSNGWFTLQGFDAAVSYDRIELRSLPDDVKLVDAKNKPAFSRQDATAAVIIGELKLEFAEASLEALKATIAADNSRTQKSGDKPDHDLALQAASLQQSAILAESEYERLTAGGDYKKVKAAKAKTKKAQEQLTAILSGGEVTYSPIRASRKALEGPAHKEADYPAVYPTSSTGRRTALARWITSKQNPLTARVAVNHVWMRHFGEPLVESVFDFGLRAKKPLHSDLLDYLAADFMEHDWSFKRLHRMIVTSNAYRLTSSVQNADSATVVADPDNKFYWRANTRRMESQVVRDSLLHLAGTLDLKLGGPSLDVGNKSLRRSLYYKHSRDSQDKFLTMFDDADLLQCYRRSESIVPQQALALANSEVSMQQATKIADRLTGSLTEAGQKTFVKTAIETLLGRASRQGEEEYCLTFCKDLDTLLKTDPSVSDTDRPARIRTRLIHSLLNHNDFISIR